MDTKGTIIDLLLSTKRAGMDKMLKWLEDEGFFTAPASTRFHGAHEGGLAEHSELVYDYLLGYTLTLKLDELSKVQSPGQKPLLIEPESIIIAPLLHDVCKVGAYLPNPGGKTPYKWNKGQPKGHALLSIDRIRKFITLEPIEEMMIKYHMGVYGLNEFYSEDDWQTGEYPLRSDHSEYAEMTKEDSKIARYGASMVNAWYHNPIVKVMYFCDELATLQEKTKEIERENPCHK